MLANRNLTLLIIDDDKDILKSFEIGLDDTNYDFTLVTDPFYAYELYVNNNFDVVITDYKMPGMSGITLLKKIREHNPLAKIIIITAYGELSTAKEAINNRAIGFFTKPINLIEFIDFLKEIEKEIKYEKNNRIDINKLLASKNNLVKIYENIVNQISDIEKGNKYNGF